MSFWNPVFILTFIQETNFEESFESMPCSFHPRPTAPYRCMHGGGKSRLPPDPGFSSYIQPCVICSTMKCMAQELLSWTHSTKSLQTTKIVSLHGCKLHFLLSSLQWLNDEYQTWYKYTENQKAVARSKKQRMTQTSKKTKADLSHSTDEQCLMRRVDVHRTSIMASHVHLFRNLQTQRLQDLRKFSTKTNQDHCNLSHKEVNLNVGIYLSIWCPHNERAILATTDKLIAFIIWEITPQSLFRWKLCWRVCLTHIEDKSA